MSTVLVGLLACGACGQETSEGWDSEGLLRFASVLMKEGEYYRAATEYLRVLFASPMVPGETRGLAATGVGVAHYLGGDYAGVIGWFEKHLDEARGTSNWSDAQIAYLSAFLEVGQAEECVQRARLLNTSEGELLRAIGLGHLRQWDGAISALDQLAGDEKYAQAVETNLQTLTEARQQRYRDATLAAVLGVVPGLGYAYANHAQSAISAFLMNSLLGYATYEAMRLEHYALGSVVGFLAVTWYAGSIYGSAKAASRYNDRTAERYLNRLDYLPEWAFTGSFPH